jgi:hypothetical protein
LWCREVGFGGGKNEARPGKIEKIGKKGKIKKTGRREE